MISFQGQYVKKKIVQSNEKPRIGSKVPSNRNTASFVGAEGKKRGTRRQLSGAFRVKGEREGTER